MAFGKKGGYFRLGMAENPLESLVKRFPFKFVSIPLIRL